MFIYRTAIRLPFHFSFALFIFSLASPTDPCVNHVATATPSRQPKGTPMPTITASTPKDEFTIAGHTFLAFHPYSEGHPLTANEAASLNQTFTENVRNNFSKTVKNAAEAGTLDTDAMQALLDTYMNTYEFGVRRGGGGGGRTADPVKARAMELARDAVRKKIKEVGGNLKDYPAKDISERARKAVESNPRFTQLAASQIEMEKDIDTGSVDLDSPQASAEEKPRRKSA
jgi:hypothetical protein